MLALEEERDDVEKKVGEALDENFDVLEEKRLKKAGMGFTFFNRVEDPVRSVDFGHKFKSESTGQSLKLWLIKSN